MARDGKTRIRCSSYGFTLIELLVVITIIGVLAAVVVFSVRGVTDKGQSAANATSVQTLRTAEEAYFAKNNQYAPNEAALISAGFLASPSAAAITVDTNNVDPTKPGGFNVVCTPRNPADCSGAQAAGASVRGGSIVVGETFTVSTTNVASSTSGGVHALWESMYNGLISLDGAGNPSPELASVVPTVANGGITNGGATYTLHLRSGVVWQDSTPTVPQPFTSADVKFTFEKVLFQFHSRAKTMAPLLGFNSGTCIASGITTPDASTVVFNFSTPYAAFLDQLNVTEAAQNPSHLYPSVEPSGCPTQAGMDANTVGTGPFQLTGTGAGINVPVTGDATVVKNPQYWKAGLPYLNSIVMVPLTTDAPRYNALVSGAVGYVWDTPNVDVSALQGLSGFQTSSTESLGGGPNSLDEFIFNLWADGSSVAAIQGGTASPHPILSDLNVRKAIAEAIDRNAYLAARFNVGTVAQGPISNQIFGHESDIALPSLNVTAANALLDGAGWGNPTRTTTTDGTPNVREALGHASPAIADGTPMIINFIYGSTTLTNQVGVLKANLASVGIDLNVTLNTATGAAGATTAWFTNRAYDAYILNYAQGYDPQVGVPRQYLTSQISTTGTPNNAAGYRNTLVDADLTQASMTLDPTARYNLYHDFQSRVVADLPYVWLIETPSVRGFTSKCTGFKVYTGLFAESASCSG
jgi:peptide/nickel transport system substrate-binding protein